ncbi:MAG TPA: ISL3 family transposase [Actinobacteria bacterium]|nr:ISL3 family transposase [Actinomycetota bacterium]
MRSTTLWARLLGLVKAVVEDVEFDEVDECIVVSVRPRKGVKRRCGRCGKRCPGYDQGEGRRRWRTLDLGTIRAFVEADSPRVRCGDHGVVTAQVPWARHGAGHTYAFDDTTAWLVTHCSKSAVRDLLRVAWRTVGAIVTRVVADAEEATDRFANLRRIGIDEISYKRGHKYLTVVVEGDTGVLLWAHPGRDRKTLERFFDRLGTERCAEITLVSADAAEWIANVVAARCENVELCLDPFHIVAWATKALDEVRREVWNAARRDGQKAVARDLKGARYALWKNPEDLTVRQAAKLADIARTNKRLYRAYLLKEQLRQVFALKGADGIALLDQWLQWARRCRIPSFAKLAGSITEHRAGIEAALTHGLSNARVESVNTKLRLLTRIAFGFRSPEALVALAMLDLGGLCPPLPGRAAA